jgi:hypothetical protein
MASLPAQTIAQEIQEELQRQHACLDMLPALHQGDEQQLLLPAALLLAAAASSELMLGCAMTQDEAGVWVARVCENVGAAMVLRACAVTQVRRQAF